MMHKQSGKLWKEAVVVYIKVLSRHLDRGIEENHANLRAVSVAAKTRTRYMSESLSPETRRRRPRKTEEVAGRK
jgi:hypothetical protein